MRKYYKKKSKKNSLLSGISSLLLLSFFWFSFIYGVGVAILIFVVCLSCIAAVTIYVDYLEKRKLLDSGIFEIDKMTGHQFEQFICLHFRNMGYSGYVTKGSHDYGADVVVEKDRVITVIQAKRWSQKVSIEAVQQVAAAVKHYNANNALVITNNYFTSNACALAKTNNIELWDRSLLIEKLIERRKKDRIEPVINNHDYECCPMCNSKLIIRNGKNGSFLGCERFPHCNFSKNI